MVKTIIAAIGIVIGLSCATSAEAHSFENQVCHEWKEYVPGHHDKNGHWVPAFWKAKVKCESVPHSHYHPTVTVRHPVTRHHHGHGITIRVGGHHGHRGHHHHGVGFRIRL